ncbi:hypothetical protein [Paeniglutamicibacter psychrophenolicus]|uniref:hypothetical protein n=1 Tax=Paeniglutamicibacter psychrophenolicus TaxID=257454 RepID=UPI0027898C1D|nr:hypothetical protein [Paeniglutamicibacter psychrophenolicus]MDQ0092325.1 hypothetical protein [Paeniglutamicibacter psychrophenolicus]
MKLLSSTAFVLSRGRHVHVIGLDLGTFRLGDHRNFAPFPVDQLAVGILVAVKQGADVILANDPRRGRGKDRGILGWRAKFHFVEQQVQHHGHERA